MIPAFEVSGAIGRTTGEGLAFPMVIMDVPKAYRNQSQYRMTCDDAMTLASSLITASIRAEADTLVARVLATRGASREECQQFLNEMREHDRI